MSGQPRRARAGALPAAVATALLLFATGAHAASTQRVTVIASIAPIYDSNILEYSSDQVSQFESGLRPERFSLETTDDLVWNPSLALSWELSGAGGRRHALRVRAEGDFHQRNATADFHAVSVGWRESWSRERRLSASWYVLPEFYLRQLTDEDLVLPYPGLSRYRRAAFALDIGSLDWSQGVGSGGLLTASGQYERRRYNAGFRERDSNTGQGELEYAWTRLPSHGRLSIRGLYRMSVARAQDGDEIAGLPPDDVDVSYHGIGFGAHDEIELGRVARWRFGGDADYLYTTRSYDSDRAADRYHFGRRDRLSTLELGATVRWRRMWRARGFWQFDRNLARLGAAAPSSTDTGDYSRSQAGLRIEWSGTLWRTKSQAAEGDE